MNNLENKLDITVKLTNNEKNDQVDAEMNFKSNYLSDFELNMIFPLVVKGFVETIKSKRIEEYCCDSDCDETNILNELISETQKVFEEYYWEEENEEEF